MRLVVLDAVKLCGKLFGIGIKGRRQRLRNTREFRENLDLKRSSSTAAMSLPSQTIAAEAFPWYALIPSIFISRFVSVPYWKFMR